ncbi:MAG: 5-methyltetrahydropteroyltriglutamate--homocysteine S-methyltransferase [Candidatus Dormibacteraeota bacterium]|nr:5-methyltetrahydropteroyltriglutamate--homocysteine S-methyltransferase [Candidatus Dormibacteraeota bacterium]
MTTRYHAEHVGSLLRPPELLEVRKARSLLDPRDDRLRELEDRAVLDALELQRQAGIEVFTDGEMRRNNWMAGLLEQVGGVVPGPSTDEAVRWHFDSGGAPPVAETHFDSVAVAEKVYRKLDLTSIEAEFLARHAPGQYKITMMSSAMGSMLWGEGISEQAYATPEQLIDDLVKLQVEEIEGLIDQGVNWLQIDSLSYNWILDDTVREQLAAGVDAGVILDASVNVDNRLVRAAKAKNPDVTVAMHFCRGNNRSAWFAEGSYDPLAEKLFGGTDFDRYLLEYDTERSGGFEPLRFVPRGKTVVLGIISSKLPELEPQDALQRRVEEASRYVAIEDLAISPQCGFASTAPGNLLTVDQERRKLELVVETARKIWG